MICLEKISWQAPAFALEDISFSIDAEKYAVLMGRTGAGKTTLLEIICGLRKPKSGSVLLEGRNVTRLLPGSRGVGYVPQDSALFPTMNVRGQIGFGLKIRGSAPQEIRKNVEELATEMEITHLLDRKPAELSGGEKQRVALARALALRPRVLLLDEPLASLDEETHEEMMALLRRIHGLHHMTVLHVTHSRRECDALAEVQLRLEGGRVI